ncbi:MAG: hypothetical protein MPW16_04055 [Candidatus Manganitrophus sp.]|nr:MAG: hypothetical protein MPW16_04055 [Candidatus Manganitrophus sp.]
MGHVHVREQGTHRGVFKGSHRWTSRDLDVDRDLSDCRGRLIERWGRIDTQELYEQLGYRLKKEGE